MEKHIYALYELADQAPRVFGVKTGTRLDNMFYVYEQDESGRIMKRTLGGIPYQSIMNLVGSPDTGKSLFAMQFALYQASLNYKIVILTTETPAKFLYNSIKERSLVLGKNFDEISRNIYIVDVSEDDKLRTSPHAILELMKNAIETSGATISLVDSITGLYEHNELDARKVVRRFYNFLKSKKQTGFLISQKRRSQESSTVEAAGGLGVAHIVDGSIVLDKKLVSTKYEETIYGVSLGSVIRTIRIDGCRLAGHEQSTHILKINDAGVVDIGEELSLHIKKNRERAML